MTASLYFESTETHVFDSYGRWVRSWFFCEGCGRAYESKRDAYECCRWGTASKKIQAHTCLSCGRAFTDYESLRAHIAEHERRALEAEKLRSSSRAREALIGEGEASCDRCGRVVGLKEIKSIFHDPRGLKVDLCRICFSRYPTLGT